MARRRRFDQSASEVGRMTRLNGGDEASGGPIVLIHDTSGGTEVGGNSNAFKD
jgi:hypothetical protein